MAIVMRTHFGGSGHARRWAVQRQAMAATSSSVTHGGRLATCVAIAAAIAMLEVRRADVRVDREPGQPQAEGFAVLVRIDDPAAELREARLHVEPLEAVPVEDVRDDVGACVLLGVQSLATGVGLPRNPAQRVARLVGLQAREVFLAARAVLRAPGVGLDGGRRQGPVRGPRPRDRRVLGVHDGPGAKQPERVARREHEAREQHAATPLRLDRDLCRHASDGRDVDDAGRRSVEPDLDPRAWGARVILEQESEADFLAREGRSRRVQAQREAGERAVTVVHGHEAEAHQQEGEAEAEVVVVVEPAHHHREHHCGVSDP